MTGSRRWAALGVLAAGLSLIVLDGTIVGIALPQIITDLGLDLTDAQWVNSLYSVVFAALLLSAGRLGDRRGRRTVFVSGVGIFVLGSLLAARADAASSLIAARAVQGVGGAMVLPASLSTVNAAFRGRDRAVAFGVWGAVMAGMAAVGPLLGGWLTTSFGWRWIFLVNLPLGIAVIIAALLLVPDTRGEVSGPGADVDGLLTSSLGFGLLVFGLIEGPSLGWWHPKDQLSIFGWTWPADAPISAAAGALALGIVGIALFILWERHRGHNGRSAILDLRLFRIRSFSLGNVTALAVAAGEFALVFVLPLYLVNARGLSIMQAGWVLAAMAIGAFISGASARHLAARLGAPGVVVLGLVLEVAGVAGTAALTSAMGAIWAIAAVMVVYGVGLGLASAQLTSTVLGQVPPGQSGSASATQSTVRQVGAALGTALAGTALAARLATALPDELATVRGLPGALAGRLADAAASSAGGSIVGLRSQGGHGQQGQLAPQVVDALSRGFASATGAAAWLACGFLAVGLLCAIALARGYAAAPATGPEEGPRVVSSTPPGGRAR
ncbi:MAG: DHA2 family efflux MFS transporter permease subunit [Micrococcales bacterium]|nr:DHA2 family efflux MFS transporter permease subunit [Micrococcales bacterium]